MKKTDRFVYITLDFAALLDGVADLDGLVLDVLPQLADDLVDLEALALLLVRHDRAAVLVGDVHALLLVGGAADAVEVRLAELLEDRVEDWRAGHLLAVPVVLRVGFPLVAVRVLVVAAIVVAVVLVALAHGAGEDREGHEAEDEEISPHGGGGGRRWGARRRLKWRRFNP